MRKSAGATRALPWTVALLAACGACADAEPAAEPSPSAAAEARRTVAHRMDAYVAAIRADDTASIRGFWSDSARVFEPNVEIDGGGRMASVISGLLGTMELTRFTLVTTDLAVHDGGTVAYLWGKVDETLEPRDGKGAARTTQANFLARWVKEADGAWRIDRLIETPLPPDPDAAEHEAP